MIRAWLCVLVILTGPAAAETAKVTSGEHEGFTRLVFNYGKPVVWSFGRTEDGYILHIDEAELDYDLEDAFALIGRSRLAGLTASAKSGDIRIGMACACHAIPFEFRPGIVVVDLKDGAPPKGSSFELTLKNAPALDLMARARPRQRQIEVQPPQANTPKPVYDWLTITLPALSTSSVSPESSRGAQSQFLPPDPSLQPLRTTLMQQLARGASQGVIDMAEVPKGLELSDSSFPFGQISIGEARARLTDSANTQPENLAADGTTCFGKDELNIATWGDEATPFITQLAEMRTGLTGEFDRSNPDAVSKAVQLHLFLGFGAEARQAIKAFDLQGSPAQIWQGLSFLLEGDLDPQSTFSGQAACDGPAALWALLNDDQLTKGDAVNDGAIRLAFADLPLHLRRLIAPKLTERFFDIGNQDAARAVATSITRAAGDKDDKTVLISAALELRSGDSAKSEDLVNLVIADPGPEHLEALIALVETRSAQKLPVTGETVLALEAFLADHLGTTLEPRLREAIMLSQALSGDFFAAFDALPGFPTRRNLLWELVAELAPDDTFLELSVLAQGTQAPMVDENSAAAISSRLIDLGLGSAATPWLLRTATPDPFLVAEAALQKGDARAALRTLAGSEGENSTALKLRAFRMLGEHGLEAETMTKLGDLPAATVALARESNWAQISTAGVGLWQLLADRLAPTALATDADNTADLTIAQGQALIDSGTTTRTTIEALLREVSFPATLSQ